MEGLPVMILGSEKEVEIKNKHNNIKQYYE